MDFSGKVVLVTGGSRGIGRACALAFAKAKAKVVAIAYVTNDVAANETCGLVEAAGAKAVSFKFDVVDSGECARTVEALVRDHGSLDVLVNNAGISVDNLVMRFKDEDWDRVQSVNLRSVFSLCRAASRPMMRQRRGAIVNLTSVVGEAGNSGQSVYAASKAGIIGFSKSLAQELSRRNIRVNCVSPGFVETDMTGALPPEAKARLVERVPLGRPGSAQDVANAVLFLASDLAAYVTGQVLRINGGMYM